MSDYPVTRGSRFGDPHPTLRLAALAAVIAGVLLVAAAAFLLSYEGIHQIALQAGVSPTLARLYPLMFDAMLIIACAATLALRSAGWGSKCYVWACLLLVLAAVAVGDALHATGVRLDGQPARAAVAIIPWVLLLMGFGIWLVMLRHWRRIRAAGAATGAGTATGTGTATGAATGTGIATDAGAATGTGTASRAGAATGTVVSRAGQAGAGAAAVAGSAAAIAGGAVTWAAGRGATPTRTGAPRSGIDELMEPRTGQAPERAPAAENAAAGKPAAGQEQPRTAAPDRGQPAAAGTTGKAGATAAGTGTGTGQNGATTGATTTGATTTGATTTGATTTGATTTGAITGAAQTGPDAAVAAGAAGAAAAGTAAAGTAASRAAGSARTGKDGNGKDGNGKESTGKDNGGKDKTEAPDRRTRLGGLREIPVSAVDDEEGSVRLLPAQPKVPAQGAASGKDSKTGEAGTPEGDADHAAETSPPVPAAALAPQFDRLRSSPTPPEDPGADGR